MSALRQPLDDLPGVEAEQLVGWGAKAHILARPHFRSTYCGRRLDDDASQASVWTPRCKRCTDKATAAEERRLLLEKRRELSEEKVDANRAGRFVVFRCMLCGTQHHPASHGQPFCIAAGHIAELEAIEVAGPPFEANGEAT